MIIVMQEGATQEQIRRVVDLLGRRGLDAQATSSAGRTILGVCGDPSGGGEIPSLELLPGVHRVVRLRDPFRLAGRDRRPGGTVVVAGEVRIGGPEVIIMAGPCAVESSDQIMRIAESVAAAGAKVLRGGAYKPRTSPYSFQGLAREGLELLRRAADATGLKVVTEVMDAADISLVEDHAEILQVGARNMQNFSLLKALGRASRPVLLKRGMSATLEEWLLSAEYIMDGGNHQVILCERGIRTFERSARNTMDISAIPILKSLSHLPVVADPSHGTGIRDKVVPMARAAVAAGADGLLLEVHHDPDQALSDGPQSLLPGQFRSLMDQLRIIAPAVERHLDP